MDKNNTETQSKTNINWYPGHMVKTKRQIADDLKLIDVVIELLDARIPVSSQNPDIAGIIGNKKRIIVLNKSDLSDANQNKKWAECFEKKGIPAVLVDSNSGQGTSLVLKEVQKIMQADLAKALSKGIKGKSIRIMIIGIPNVGKSSFINRISKKTSMAVANRPGVTVKKQWVRIENNIELLDTPGVLWPKFESEEVGLNLAYTGSIKDDIIQKTEVAYSLIKYLLNEYEKNILLRYKIASEDIQNEKSEDNNIPLDFMNIIGRKRGAIVSGGRVDLEKVSNIILEDFRTGKLGKITLEKRN
ncbi:MAG: ribosome biogenesis GTPase YlqF [Lachnospiraceae bacterium]|nr:ribosome biogenesis GTPase YlqF [Lachnospiraceae bacterium]